MTERQRKYQAQYEEGLLGMLVDSYMDILGKGCWKKRKRPARTRHSRCPKRTGRVF